MNETYRCPDGRELVLTFNEDLMRVEAITRGGELVGHFQFELLGANGAHVALMDDTGEAASLRLAKAHLEVAWRGQGVAERAGRLVEDEISLRPAIGLVKEG